MLVFFVIDKAVLQTVNNHPVHILNNEGEFSPSSFIPFCSFGKEFIGTKINEFNVPVCDIFNPKHYFDKLCYETDLKNLKDNQKLDNQLKIGLTLLLDLNEERQTIGKNHLESESNSIKSFYQDDASSFSIFVDTISIQFYDVVISFHFSLLDSVGIFEEGKYNLINIMETSVTDSFMGLDRDVRKCQKTEAYDYCKTWLYVDNLRKECGCLPLSLWLSEKVKV